MCVEKEKRKRERETTKRKKKRRRAWKKKTKLQIFPFLNYEILKNQFFEIPSLFYFLKLQESIHSMILFFKESQNSYSKIPIIIVDNPKIHIIRLL